MIRTAGLTFATALGLFLAAHSQPQSPSVEVHYLGHAAFLLEFPTGLTVLTDHGESQAYALDSPVFELGAVRPDVVTRSHDHPDHAGGELPEGVTTTVAAGERFKAKGVRITPIPTFESGLDAPDNVSFLFEHAGLKILYLGDCQALIQRVGEPGVRERVREVYPDTYDLVFLPIGFVHDILSEAVEFATLLNARRLVPVHYWRPADRDAFLNMMRGRLDARGREYRVTVSPQTVYVLSGAEQQEHVVEVVGLTAGPVPLPSGPYLGEPLPDSIPTLFAPGIVSGVHWEHSAPAFSSSGDLVLWTEISDESRIRMSEQMEGRWRPARVAPWSGTFSDFYPSVSADDRQVFFSSYRPWDGGGENPGYGITIWRVDRTPSGWGEPVRLGGSIATGNEFGFSLSADGTLYFTRAAGDTFRIFRAERREGCYSEPVMLPPEVNSSAYQDGPFVTPDDRVLLFESIRPDGFGGADLYVSVRAPGGNWSPAVNLGPTVNTSGAERFARISSDGRYLFFGSDRNGDRGDLFWVSVDAVAPLQRALVGSLQSPSG